MPTQDIPARLVVFSDFDGTISTEDVGNRLFHYFSGGRSEEPVGQWRQGIIDSRQCLLAEAELMRDVTERELRDFIDTFSIDETFAAFVDLMRRQAVPFNVLSDGLDLYIDQLLEREGLTGLPVLANKARIEQKRLKLSFPYLEDSCGGCANCKGYHIRRLRPQGARTIYIGDGKSDLCALPEADIIFAKGYLAEYCRSHHIEYLPFEKFSAISSAVTRNILPV